MDGGSLPGAESAAPGTFIALPSGGVLVSAALVDEYANESMVIAWNSVRLSGPGVSEHTAYPSMASRGACVRLRFANCSGEFHAQSAAGQSICTGRVLRRLPILGVAN